VVDAHSLVQVSALALVATLLLACVVWVPSVPLRDVSIVDSAWSLLVITPAVVTTLALAQTGPRTAVVWLLAALWALRLSIYIAWRHWCGGEDRRYQVIRARNQPHFEWKSLYLVFGLQAVLAWVVSAPLVGAIAGTAPFGVLDMLGMSLFAVGFVFESVADAQLARFQANPSNRGRVMAQGLWRYTRHPNYFGECCVWWGLWLIAASAGAWWSVVSPLLMTVLLIKVSGVSLLERDITERRPAYRDYIARTNAFVPGRPRS
jgi:steroid 5-alpha reductase family enzyme